MKISSFAIILLVIILSIISFGFGNSKMGDRILQVVAESQTIEAQQSVHPISTPSPYAVREPQLSDQVTVHEALPAFCNRDPGGIYEVLFNGRVVCSSSYIGKAEFVLRAITHQVTTGTAHMRVVPDRTQVIEWHQCPDGSSPAMVRDDSVWEGEQVCVSVVWSEGSDPTPHISFRFADNRDRRYLYQDSGTMDGQSMKLINNNVYTLPMIPGQDGRLELITGKLISSEGINTVLESLPFTEYLATVSGISREARLRIRAGPGERYEILGYLDWNDHVHVIRPGWHNTVDNAVWREVRTSSGREGWVNGDYLDVPRSRH